MNETITARLSRLDLDRIKGYQRLLDFITVSIGREEKEEATGD